MQVRSLGYRTDLMVRRLAGSQILDRGHHLVISSRANPDFYWGNFLLLDAPPRPDEGERWLRAFAAEFPGARHVAIGVDTTDGDPGASDDLTAAGLTVETDIVLRASSLRQPAPPRMAAVDRPLASGEDWKQAADLRQAVAVADGFDSTQHRRFLERQIDEARLLVGAGHGRVFGAFVEGRLLALLGLVTDGTGVARFQSVETHPDHRRQGLASTLVYRAGQFGIRDMGARALVIVADPAGPAIGIYRALGFTEVERQVGLARPAPPPPRAPAAPDRRSVEKAP
jgi:ribosomal protein S18 acetylase RimI-like enzyme